MATTESPSQASNSSDCARLSGDSLYDTNDTWVVQPSTTNTTDFNFTTCSEPNCDNSSAFSLPHATTLRCGFSTCTHHTTIEMVGQRAQELVPGSVNTTIIFYDVGLTSSMEMGNISAVASSGEIFDIILKTTSGARTNNPVTSQLRPLIYSILATEPKVALEHFINWVHRIRSEETNHRDRKSNIILVAHNGMCRAHVGLVKAMIVWGLPLPTWRFSDCLPMFMFSDEDCGLAALSFRYAAWFSHRLGDTLSNARALRHVVRWSYDAQWRAACLVCSCSFDHFIMSVGLNTIKVI
jgi:hypothetical protein